MSGEELEGQRRELFGEDVGTVHCDICGTAIPQHQLRAVESDSAPDDHGHAPMICPSCRAAIQSGEIDAGSVLLDEDDEPQTVDEPR